MNILGFFKRTRNIRQTNSKPIELTVAESENLYRILIEDSLDAVVLTQDFRFVYFNRVFCQMMGYTQDELMTIEPTTVIAPDEHVRILEFHKKRMAGEVLTQNYAAKFVRKNGSEFLAELNATSVQIKGKPASLITMRDITEKEKLSRALSESEAKYKAIVENSQDSIMIIRDNKLLFANYTYCNMLGYEYEELLEMQSIEPIFPEDRYKASKIAERRRACDFSTIRDNVRMLTKSGEIKECECVATVIEYNGIPASFMTLHDITESRRMQDALAKSERRFRELTELLPQAVYELDACNTPTFMNKTGREMFKMGDMSFESSKAYDFFSPEDTERMKEALGEESKYKLSENGVLITDTSRASAYTAHRMDGSTFPVLIYGSPIIEDGEFKGSRGIIVDITDRVEMEKALQESELRYRTLIQSLQEGLFVIQDGKFVFLNDAIVDIVGYSVEELTGESFLKVIAPAYKQLVADNHQLRVEGKISPENYEVCLIKNDGVTEVPVILSVTITEYQGKWALLGTAKDITQRKKVEQALKESEEKYRMLVDDANDGIVLTQEGKLKLANKAMCKILQYDFPEFEDQVFYNFVHPDDIAQMIEYHSRRMTGEDFTALYRARLIRKDKEIITVELNARTIVYNNLPAAFIIVRDITERIAIENELKTAKAELEKLNKNLETRVIESSQKLAETHMQLVNLQKENLQSQFDVLRQQVNPHFLFNSLNVLTSLIKIEPDLAEQFSEHLSKVYRYVLENKDNELVDLSTELRFLDAYIFLLNIRFIDKIKVNIDIPANMLSAQIIPLAMQLLIENAIKHNIMSKSKPLVIDIFIEENNYLNIINNLQERPSQVVSTGIGLKNIENRYLLLNNTKPIFQKTETHFIAKVPLVLKQWCWAERY